MGTPAVRIGLLISLLLLAYSSIAEAQSRPDGSRPGWLRAAFSSPARQTVDPFLDLAPIPDETASPVITAEHQQTAAAVSESIQQVADWQPSPVRAARNPRPAQDDVLPPEDLPLDEEGDPYADPLDPPHYEATTFDRQLSTEMPWEELGDQPLPERLFDETEEAAPAGPPARKPLLQELLSGTHAQVSWLAPVDGFGVTEVGLRTVDPLPIFLGPGPPLQLATAFGNSFVDSPAYLGLPTQLYSMNFELRYMKILSRTLILDVAAGPGWFSDFQSSAMRGFRVTGRVLFLWQMNEQWSSALGVVYIGRQGLPALPAVGVIWTPRPDTRVEITMPRPRIAQRIGGTDSRQHWIYGGFELFGGNSWSVSRADGSEDVFSYTDYRLIAGYEMKTTSGMQWQVEAGYVFSRSATFRDDPASLHPGNTAMIRSGITF